MRVMKFGGTSVGNARAIAGTAEILARERQHGPIVAVVSAMSGITNTLLDAAEAAVAGDSETVETARALILAPHRTALTRLIPSGQRRRETSAAVSTLVDEASRLLYSIYILRELSPRARDRLVSFGERMSSLLVAAYLEEIGTPARAVASDKLIVTDSVFGSAAPQLEPTRARAQERLKPLLDDGVLPVVTGYFGANEEGLTTTLGRGGSDFSASILANALDAEEVWIWTDVDGVMTADPRMVEGARTLDSLTYDEATELAYFGAKVIHPKTMYPAAERSIPIWIKNTFNPDEPGTCIGPQKPNHTVAKAIATVPGLAAVTVEGRGLIEVSQVTARIFAAIGHTDANVYMISQASSQHSVTFIVRNQDLQVVTAALEDEFREDIRSQRVLSIGIDRDLTIVAVVGEGMRGTPGVAGKVFVTMGDNDVNIVAIAQGSSELNISFAISEKDVVRAVSA
ncbi:MAG: aspartate kinase, partial [Chloroflexota bacterium]